MKLQQGVGSLADAFLSFSKTGTGSAVAVYTVPTANEGAIPPILPTTALVKSIRLFNGTAGSVTTTVSMFDSSNSNLEIPIVKGAIATDAEVEILANPIVLEQADSIKITGIGVVILISLMEIS
tara:strand:- start:6 stop:377 length:372 start_codon:yes stop_codon:yes gene_type:complete